MSRRRQVGSEDRDELFNERLALARRSPAILHDGRKLFVEDSDSSGHLTPF
jgi:hypothetical protein